MKNKNNKPLIDKILSKKEIIITIAGALTASYPVVNAVYNLLYQRHCEAFYHLPEKYFHTNINNSLLNLCFAFLLLLACIIPILMKKYYEKKENKSNDSSLYTVLTGIIGFAAGTLNVFNLTEIMKQTHKINNFFRMINSSMDAHANITVFVVALLWTMALIGITNADKIKCIRRKKVKQIVSFVVVISFVISLMMMMYGTIIKLCVTVEDKTKYEIVNINDESYVVLSECEDKLLVVPYEVTKDGQCIFKTKQYMFVDMYDGIYQYVDICSSPIIEYK